MVFVGGIGSVEGGANTPGNKIAKIVMFLTLRFQTSTSATHEVQATLFLTIFGEREGLLYLNSQIGKVVHNVSFLELSSTLIFTRKVSIIIQKCYLCM